MRKLNQHQGAWTFDNIKMTEQTIIVELIKMQLESINGALMALSSTLSIVSTRATGGTAKEFSLTLTAVHNLRNKLVNNVSNLVEERMVREYLSDPKVLEIAGLSTEHIEMFEQIRKEAQESMQEAEAEELRIRTLRLLAEQCLDAGAPLDGARATSRDESYRDEQQCDLGEVPITPLSTGVDQN